MRCLIKLKEILDHDSEYDEFLEIELIPQLGDKEKIIEIIEHSLTSKFIAASVHEILLRFCQRYNICIQCKATISAAFVLSEETQTLFVEKLENQS